MVRKGWRAATWVVQIVRGPRPQLRQLLEQGQPRLPQLNKSSVAKTSGVRLFQDPNAKVRAAHERVATLERALSAVDALEGFEVAELPSPLTRKITTHCQMRIGGTPPSRQGRRQMERRVGKAELCDRYDKIGEGQWSSPRSGVPTRTQAGCQATGPPRPKSGREGTCGVAENPVGRTTKFDWSGSRPGHQVHDGRPMGRPEMNRHTEPNPTVRGSPKIKEGDRILMKMTELFQSMDMLGTKMARNFEAQVRQEVAKDRRYRK